MSINKTYLSNLCATEDYNSLTNEVHKHRPMILPYDYANDNTEEWKYKSAMQQGFDLCFKLLTLHEVQEQ